MPTPPPQSAEARAAALEKAAMSRRVRAEAKEKLKIGSMNLAELFAAADQTDDTGEMLAKLKVVNVLESLPGVGKVGARKLMDSLDISETRRVRGLGANQRKALLERFPD
jgi:hypothetical protein